MKNTKTTFFSDIKKFLEVFVFATVIVTMVACATPPVIADLKPPKNNAPPIELKENLSYTVIGAFGKESTIGILHGPYRLHLENSIGKYYIGQLPSVWWKLGDDIIFAYGGIWIPNDSSLMPFFYFTPSRIAYSAKTFGEAIAKREKAPLAFEAKNEDSTAIQALAMRSTPANMSPVQAGIAGGIVGGIMGGIMSLDIPSGYPPPKPGPEAESFKNSALQVFSPSKGD
ncbi:hypothetical protein [Undibacterium sp. Ji49W]|uniref:hypothetical protein n=1 Tax=Undibacterium sp. Ji49W TaxID=3413040 RepID=UPI003BF3AD1B